MFGLKPGFKLEMRSEIFCVKRLERKLRNISEQDPKNILKKESWDILGKKLDKRG